MMTNIYEAELEDIQERSYTDGELIISLTISALMGVLNSPEDMQLSFVELLTDFARSAIIELQMNRNN